MIYLCHLDGVSAQRAPRDAVHGSDLDFILSTSRLKLEPLEKTHEEEEYLGPGV